VGVAATGNFVKWK